MLRSFLQFIGIIGSAFFAIIVLNIVAGQAALPELVYERPTEEVATTTAATTTPVLAEATSTPKKKEAPVKKAAAKAQNTQPAAAAASEDTTPKNQVHRIENPYPSVPKATNVLDAFARGALVNIFCQTGGGPLSSISGSGVIIDPRGVILTNAHVAQYVLLASDPQITLQCFIRSGSPAEARWKASILYFPSAWVNEHAEDIAKSKPKGTGENDYALLLITSSLDGTPLPAAFPYLPFDTREAIAFTSDSVLLAGYPAEFAGGSATRSTLYPTSVFTRIGDLLTFAESSVDIISLGSVALAQSGSSGGAVVNLWGQLVGIISTTSEGETTASRELRAITLSYIDRAITKKMGASLESFVRGDVSASAAAFMANNAPTLRKQIIDQLP